MKKFMVEVQERTKFFVEVSSESEEVVNGIRRDAYYAAINSGASEEEARSFANEYCYELRSQLIYD